MSNKKEITVDVSAFGGALDGFKFFVQQVEYRSEFLRTPTVHMKVLGVLDAAPVAVPTDIKLASDALKSAADLYGQAKSQPVPEGVSIHHDLERRFTIAYRISANGKLAFVGIAYCSPQDQFCRRTGRELAIIVGEAEFSAGAGTDAAAGEGALIRKSERGFEFHGLDFLWIGADGRAIAPEPTVLDFMRRVWIEPTCTFAARAAVAADAGEELRGNGGAAFVGEVFSGSGDHVVAGAFGAWLAGTVD